MYSAKFLKHPQKILTWCPTGPNLIQKSSQHNSNISQYHSNITPKSSQHRLELVLDTPWNTRCNPLIISLVITRDSSLRGQALNMVSINWFSWCFAPPDRWRVARSHPSGFPRVSVSEIVLGFLRVLFFDHHFREDNESIKAIKKWKPHNIFICFGFSFKTPCSRPYNNPKVHK